MKRALVVGLVAVFVFSMFSAFALAMPGMREDPDNGTTDNSSDDSGSDDEQSESDEDSGIDGKAPPNWEMTWKDRVRAWYRKNIAGGIQALIDYLQGECPIYAVLER